MNISANVQEGAGGMDNSLIIALDFAKGKEIERFFSSLLGIEKLFVKVGMELFYQEGPAIVHI